MWCSLLIGWIAAAQAGALGPSVKVRRVIPPETVIPGVKTLQVGDFTGFGGETVGSEIRQALQDPQRTSGRAADGSPLGDMIDLGGDLAGEAIGGALGGVGGKFVGGLVSGMVDGATDEMGSQTLTAKDGLKVDVFEVVTSGGDAKLSGAISLSEKNENYKAKQAKRDSKGNVVKDSKGNTVYQEVSCARRIVTTEVRWQMVGGDGKLLTEKSFNRKAQDSKCAGSKGTLASKDELGKETLAGLGPRIANEFAPSWSEVKLSFQRDKSIKEALELNRNDQPEAALCAAREVAKADPYSVEANLAVGVFLEGLGFVTAAVPAYKKAAGVNNDKESMERVQGAGRRIEELSTLESSYGLNYAIGEPDYAWCPKVPEGRPVLVKKDATLWSARDSGAASKVADVPKGMKLYVVEETPEMYRVVTLDGTEGWVEPKLVK